MIYSKDFLPCTRGTIDFLSDLLFLACSIETTLDVMFAWGYGIIEGGEYYAHEMYAVFFYV